MSNKITRKGIAVGAAVALAVAGLVGAPSYAAATDVTLTPAQGSTYNSIREAGVALETLLNADEVSTEDALYYTIESTNGANIYDQLNFFFDNNQQHDDDSTEDSDSWNLLPGGTSWDASSYTEDYASYYNTSADAEDGDEVTVFAVHGDNWWEDWYGAEEDLDHNLNLNDNEQWLYIWAADSATNQNLEFTVTAWVDQDNDGAKDPFEPVSETRTVKLFDSKNVTATTTIDDSLVIGGDVYATTTFNNDINPYFVGSSEWSQYGYAYTTFYQNGSELEDSSTYVNEDTGVLTSWYEDTADIGNYTARTYYEANTATDFEDYNTGIDDDWAFVRWLSPLSTGYSLVAGTNEDVDGIIGNVVDSTTVELSDTDTGLDEESVTVKSGEKSVAVVSQILDGADALKVSNVRVKAVIDPIDLDNSSDVTVTGTTDKITDEDDADIVGYGRTNADGQFVFTVGNTQGLDGDNVEVELFYLETDGSWVQGDNFDIYWEDAVLDAFEGDVEVTSGANVTINYTATDQFGGGINELNEDTLEVTVVAWDDTEDYEEVYDTDVLEKTVAVSAAGKASVSFANFATTDGHSTVEAFLHESDLEWDVENWGSWTTDLYKNAATSEIDSVENVYENVVTYGKFYEGNIDEDDDLVANLEDYGVWYDEEDGSGDSTYVWVEGQVLTSNGAGAAAQAVTITGTKSMLFQTWYDGHSYSYDDSTSVGSVTVYTDIDGTFGFYVYSHKASEAGTPITIASGGKSFKTTLKTFMNDDIDDGIYWNGDDYVDAAVVTSNWYKLTGNKKDELTAPAFNTTYRVTVTAKDVWGNVLEGAEIDVFSDDLNGTVFGNDVWNDSDGEEIDGYATTNSMGQISFTARSESEDYRARLTAFKLEVYIDWLTYDDGSSSESYDFQVEDFGSGRYDLDYNGITGPQAAAVAGAKKGVVRVHAFNSKGKTVNVYVAGKLVKTVTADKARFLTLVKGVKAGDKRVTVKVGSKRMASTFVTVK